MLLKTHIAISTFFALLILPYINDKVIFLVMVILASAIPDADSKYALAGRGFFMRILQFFVGHRGIIHSFLFLMPVTFFLVLIFPKLAFGFFLGFSLHLLADSFTIHGIKPLYPFGETLSGIIKTGGILETGLFIFIVLSDAVLLLIRMLYLF